MMSKHVEQMSATSFNGSVDPQLTYRHPRIVRATHWLGVICIVILLMSGLQIFNAHPALYFGQASEFAHPVASIGTEQKDGREIGVTKIWGKTFNTTGVLGLSGQHDSDEHAFPAWITLPSYQDLAGGRRWHFFFAWLLVFDGLIYLVWALASGHVWRDLIPSWRQLRHIGGSILDHMRLRFPRGEEAKHYNVLQRLAYLVILLIVLPLLILAGLTMSPGLDAAFPWLTGLLGGRQSARTIHFVCAFLITGFAIVHVAMALLSGVWNNMRSMITGWYKIEP
jgi:thiosulfate reductase cytochrome b subunit